MAFQEALGGAEQRLTVGGVARGGLFIFIGSAGVAVLGYFYWFIISILSGTDTVGIASSIYSLSTLVSGFAALGIPVGVQRFLGRSFSRKDVHSLGTYYWSSVAFMFLTCLSSAILIWLMPLLDISFMGFSKQMLLFTGLISLFGFYVVMTALFSSIIKTEYAAISMLASGTVRLCVGVILVYIGLGWVGAAIGLLSESVSLTTLMLFLSRRTLRNLGTVERHISFKELGEPLRAGFSSWLPNIVALLGQQLSFIVVFGMQGSFEAGTYYIAYVVFALIYMAPSSLTAILFPILSGLEERKGRETAWSVLKISLALACPPTAFLVFYPTLPLSMMGGPYMQAASTLSVLTLSTIPLTCVSAVYSFVYANGSYGKVIGIGIATNFPRVLLYFLLVPIYGGEGAALAFLIGAIMGLILVIPISMKVHFKASLRKIAIAVIAPFLAVATTYLIGLNWLLSGIAILLTSIVLYGRLGVVERSDLAEIARGFASEKTIARMGERLGWLLKIIYGE